MKRKFDENGVKIATYSKKKQYNLNNPLVLKEALNKSEPKKLSDDEDEQQDSQLFQKLETHELPRKKQKIFSESPTPKLTTPKKGDTNSSPKKLIQCVLDFGQKALSQIMCQECGMLYNPANQQDKNAHTLYHKKVTDNYVPFAGWKDECVVKEFDQEKNERIVMVAQDAPKAHLRKLSAIRTVVDKELGISDSDQAWNVHQKTYLYISHNKIIGCVIAEPVNEGFRVINEESSTVRCSKESYLAMCGINRIWVHKKHRRQGIASALMDAVRNHFVFGYIVPLDQIAFTQPTPDGKKFFSSYTKNANFLVYHN